MAGLLDVIESNAGSLASFVGKSAPLVATMLGSPLAGMAISLICNKFGIDSKNPQEILTAISADPNADLKLKQIQFQHETELRKIANADFALEVQDRANARQYGAQYPDFLKHLAYFVTVGFFCSIASIIFLPLDISEAEKNLLLILITMLAGKWQTMIDFFYGSSNKQQGELR